MNIGEFFVTLGFNADTVKVKDFVQSLGEIPLTAAADIAALAGVDYELVKITQNAMAAAVGFQMFSAETGLSWKELQTWQIVAEQANVSADTVASSVNALERQLAEIRLGRGNIAPFQLLGISANQNAFGVLNQLRERIKGLNPAMATNLVSQMGLDPSMIHLLQLSNTEFARLSKTVSGMTGDQEGSFLRAKQSLVQFGLVAKYVGFEVVGHLIDGLYMLGGIVQKLQLWMPGLAIAAGALAVAFAPWTAAIVGLLLVLDDLAVYFKGGDSVIGMAINGIKKLGDELKNMAGNMGFLGKLATVAGLMTSPVLTGSALLTTAAGHVMNQNVTMNIHSTAPAHDVGKAAAEHLKRAANQAALQTNSQGY